MDESHRLTTAPASYLGTRTLLAAITISVVVHLLIWIGLIFHTDFFPSAGLLALFTVVDIIMWFVLLIVPIAAVQKRVFWVDPIVYFSILLLASTASMYLVFMANWHVAVDYIHFGGDNFPASPVTSVVRIIEAECLIVVFAAVMIIVNQRTVVIPRPLGASRLSRRAAFLTAGIFCSAGVVAFMHQWTATNYIEAVLNTGIRQAADPGGARYFFLQEIGGLAAVLGMIAWLLRHPGRTRMSLSTSLVFAAVVTATLIPVLVTGAIGSRIDLLFFMVTPVIVVGLQGFTLSRKVVIGGVCLLLGLILLVTLLRGQPLKPDSLSDLRDVPELITSYSNASSPLTVLLQMDRIGNLALLLQQLDTVGHYVNGSTLIANWDASMADLVQRAVGLHAFYTPVVEAQEHMSRWRGFGTMIYPVPPSIVGDLFMQRGAALFLPLSLLFSLLVLHLRRLIGRSKTWYGQFFLAILTIRLLTLAQAQISLIGPFLLFLFLPLFFGFSLVRICCTIAAVRARRVAG